jgi:hypothetical protein
MRNLLYARERDRCIITVKALSGSNILVQKTRTSGCVRFCKTRDDLDWCDKTCRKSSREAGGDH